MATNFIAQIVRGLNELKVELDGFHAAYSEAHISNPAGSYPLDCNMQTMGQMLLHLDDCPEAIRAPILYALTQLKTTCPQLHAMLAIDLHI